MPPPVALSAAETLRRLADTGDGDRVTLDEILLALGNHAFGLLVLVLALPNAIPGPVIPFLSLPFALCILALAYQILTGEARPLLPSWLRRRAITRAHFRKFVDRAEPVLRRLERWLKPRASRLVHSNDRHRVLGVALIVFALVLALPIPLGNGPQAFAICIVALGMFESDDRVIGIGIIGGVAALLVNAGIVVAGVELFDVAKHLSIF
jgi:hypothetical protein